MRYLLIDRIRQLENNKRILSIKNVALSEDVFSYHFFGAPVMPGALLIESLAQAGTALLEVSSNFEKKAILIMVKHAKFRSLVRPGDQLSVEANMTSFDGELAQMEGVIHVSDRLVMDASVVFTLKDAAEFYAPTTKHLVEAGYDFWLKDAELIGF